MDYRLEGWSIAKQRPSTAAKPQKLKSSKSRFVSEMFKFLTCTRVKYPRPRFSS